MFNIGPFELLVILIIALIVLGPKKLPELARTLGKAVGEIKKATDEIKTNLSKDIRSSIDINHIPGNNQPVTEDEKAEQKGETGEPGQKEQIPEEEKL